MKNAFIITTIILFFKIIPLNGQYQSAVIQTPRGLSVDALRFIGTDFTVPEITYWNYYWTNGYNCRILANSTNYYNCHGYAWYDIEGHMAQSDLLWINDVDQYGNPINNVTKYYSGDNRSYTQVTTVTDHLKVSYYPRDHSALTTQDQDSVISKWAYGPLVKHTLASCPFYPSSQIKYYKLNPGIDGSTTALCLNQQAIFTSNTLISGSTYTWSKDNTLLDVVSGAGTTSYIVAAKAGSGNAWLNLQITTPSGEVATTANKNVWIGTPILNYVTGPESGYMYNTYTFYADPRRDPLSQAEYTWILNPLNGNSVRPYYDYADIAFYTYGSYQVVARAENTCGMSDWAVTEISIRDNYGYSLSPNPASENLTIIVTKLATTEAEETNPELTTYTVSIFNFYGILQSSVKKTGTNFTIPVGNLKDGNYFVQISNGKKTKSLPLIIKHN